VHDVQSLSGGIYSSKLTTPRSQQNGVSLIYPADFVTGCFYSINPYGKATPDTCHSPYDIKFSCQGQFEGIPGF
jgi:hypothetical protein